MTHSGLNLPKSGGVPLVVGKREASAAILSKMSLTTEFTMHMDSVVDADPDPDFILYESGSWFLFDVDPNTYPYCVHCTVPILPV